MRTPAHDNVVFTIGSPDGPTLNMREAVLRRCVAAFTAALDTFTAGRPAEGVISTDQIPNGSTPIIL